ncbi:AraC-type DNA-binding protein [Algoriella xinjiangensis]|uniref:AraC-type DNA-binding protein n=1 Tax=Algoriella xinjiangensis TaxID=684065 RepID=A0A1I4Y7Q2_9FLAO|nr:MULTISPECIES: helix-turn-helix domain-containing protein [Algoriella]MBO6211969.1 AraC family transcriptional regulator [Algoriella sp.]SFN33783.1 AraC-type DNA-binding protein [Algoriella xinjiangensis]VDH15242.1 DNA-binding transcriptional regulator AraC [Algoriella xinjiangensis]
MSDYIQLYSLNDILRTYREQVSDRRLAIFDIGPENNYYFVRHKPYKFSSLGLILITAGTCEIAVNLEPNLIKRDDIMVVLPGQLFEILELSDDFSVQAIFIDSELIIEAGFHVKSNNLVEFLSSKYPKIISLDKKIVRDLRYNLNKISKYTIKNENIFAKDLVLHHFSILMYELGNHYNQLAMAKNTTKEVRKEELAKQFLYLVSTHFKRQRNVQFYADEMFISRKHLTKIIVEVFNKSPKQIIAEAIILEAKVLLRNPKFSVSDVVTDLNFGDTSVFSKFFKNYAGISPSTFKGNN